jgi:hypothetical protein
MPLTRYFISVGGVLLALLFIASALLPKLPPVEAKVVHLPGIRIHSDRKWPERIVFDTSAPIIRVIQSADADIVDPPAPPPPAGVIPPDLREVLAQLQTPEAGQLKRPKSDPQEPKRQRRIARKHLARPVLLAARRTQYDWFGPTVRLARADAPR